MSRRPGTGDQYGEGGTSSGDPLSGVERTSDPNLGPTSGSLTGSDDAELGMPDDPVAPEYGGEGVGMPGPNAPTSDLDYDTEAASQTDRPTYGAERLRRGHAVSGSERLDSDPGVTVGGSGAHAVGNGYSLTATRPDWTSRTSRSVRSSAGSRRTSPS